ncbi:MAG: hypothetical protein C0598_14370 [Marinilabiliales bacterium]|nr:MAG: hypothetical protein C0598_14370 [Marinilabiliales bacterium]
MFKKSFILLGAIFLSMSMFAQTLDDAGSKYNQGNEQYTAKAYADAVASYESALEICNSVGPDGDVLKGNIEKQLNNAYYRNGLSLYKGKKFEDAIAQLEKSAKLANELGDSEKAKKSTMYVGKIYTTSGQVMLKKEKPDMAIEEFNKALQINPKDYKTFLGMAMAYKEKGDLDLMLENADKTISLVEGKEKAKKYGDKAKKLAATELFNTGALEIKSNPAKAVEYLNKSLNYADPSANTYYYLAIANNKAKNFSAAIENANKALELKEDDKSDIYFELGQAQEGAGNADAACSAYKNVTGGNNVEAAKYQITTVLKCN